MANTGHNVFLSWSGERSKLVAEALRAWLPMAVQSARPWMSESDIHKGSRGQHELADALETMRHGIVCLTPENLSAAWIVFEAGALSKSLGARVCTFLTDLRPEDVPQPLGMFQATRPEKEDVLRLLRAINEATSEQPVPESALSGAFDSLWPRLELDLAVIPRPADVSEPRRSVEEMVGEVLAIERAAANSRKNTEALDQYVPKIAALIGAVDPLLPGVISELKAARNMAVHAPFQLAAYQLAAQAPTKVQFHVKLWNDDVVKVLDGTDAEEGQAGTLVVRDGEKVVARFDAGVEKWWRSPAV